MSLKNRSFLKLLDYTPAEIEELLDLAADLKACLLYTSQARTRRTARVCGCGRR